MHAQVLKTPSICWQDVPEPDGRSEGAVGAVIQLCCLITLSSAEQDMLSHASHVRFSICGKVHSQIGKSSTSAERRYSIVTLSKHRLNADLNLDGRYKPTLQIYFHIPLTGPASQSRQLTSFSPTTKLVGRRLIDQQTAFSSQRFENGQYDISHSINMTFTAQGAQIPMYSVSQLIDLAPDLFRCLLEINPLPRHSSGHFEPTFSGLARPPKPWSHYLKGVWSGKTPEPGLQTQIKFSPELDLSMSPSDSSGEDMDPPAYSGHLLRFLVMVTPAEDFSFSNNQSALYDVFAFNQRQRLKCEVTATWIMHRTFSSPPLVNNEKISDHRAVVQRIPIDFPPLEQPQIDGSGGPVSWAAQAPMELKVPDMLSLPTTKTALLDIGYTLFLDMNFILSKGHPRLEDTHLRFKAEIPLAMNWYLPKFDTVSWKD